MDRRIDSDRAATDRDRVGLGDEQAVLPSRLDARSACLEALGRGRGPVLLTGAAGSGKTWLWRQLAATTPGFGRWLGLDVAPSDDGLALVRRALRGLGRPDASSSVDPRSDLADELAEQTHEGRRWVLVVDEAQNASDAVLEEFRLLSNRLGHPDGFAAMMLVGRTGLALRLRGRAWESLDARLAGRVHLDPIDAEEARLLLDRTTARPWGREAAEALHIEALGNPSRLLQLADRLGAAPSFSHGSREPSGSAAPVPTAMGRRAAPMTEDRREAPRFAATVGRRMEARPEPEPDSASRVVEPPRLGESRPPLRFEDGVIEVGWDEADDRAAEAPTAPTERSGISIAADSPGIGEEAPARVTEPSTVSIDDPYAAIEARMQWSRAVAAVHPSLGPATGEVAGLPWPSDRHAPGADDTIREPGEEPGRSPFAQVRAEPGQEFAPYGRLFSQRDSATDPE